MNRISIESKDETMKVGILTHFHKSINYGGVLQAYALCKFVNNAGHDCRQILYIPSVTSITNSSLTVEDVFRKLVSRFSKKLHKKKNCNIKARMELLFVDFRESVPHTDREYTREDIADTNEIFDAFITGSDQVWNPIWYDPTYFLDFVKGDIPKISYASSIGISELDDEQKKAFKKHLTPFQALSVREKSAASVLTPLVERKLDVSVDPTLLLSVDDWDEIATDRKINERYVFLYALGDDIKIRKLAAGFAKHKGMKFVMIPDLLGAYRRKDRRIQAQKILDATPEDFISLIKHAEYVFTDSFHACVFSLLYKRDFFAFPRKGGIEMNSRILDLTDMFRCRERFLDEKEYMNLQYLLSMHSINYSKSFELFDHEKQKSLDYLETCLFRQRSHPKS